MLNADKTFSSSSLNGLLSTFLLSFVMCFDSSTHHLNYSCVFIVYFNPRILLVLKLLTSSNITSTAHNAFSQTFHASHRTCASPPGYQSSEILSPKNIAIHHVHSIPLRSSYAHKSSMVLGCTRFPSAPLTSESSSLHVDHEYLFLPIVPLHCSR